MGGTLFQDAKNAGLIIDGFDIGQNHHIKAGFKLDAVYTAGKVTDNHGSQTDTFLTTAGFWEKRDKLLTGWPRDADRVLLRTGELDGAVSELETAYLDAISIDYLRLLVSEYDYLTSEKAISETLIADKYHFTADGKIATRIEGLAEQQNTFN